ncbi:unnamed protein product [Paramecium octaurelia]|uniref:J domain-containing protein n=1 Tax=Paramecium octaurelia TaxID=43137 RepID=A0A8S1XVL7_PAROT|nr:unnamed protein product [Paramecium octaurelia]
MGFKEAFTRQGDGENLLFDDDAFIYFAISILTLVILPLIYSVIKPLFTTYVFGENRRKFARVPKSSNDQQNLQLAKQELRLKWLTTGYVVKIIILVALLLLLNASIQSLPKADKIKGFDPYEILEIDPSATEQEIRKAYRKISLKLHPDKNPDDPQANQKFILLTKAYECLTDEDKKSLCMKYGNPDGQQSLSVGIAMPSFLLKKENRAAFLAVIFLLLLVVVPIIVLYELRSIGKYDQNGVMLSNQEKFERGLEENLLIKKGVELSSCSDELCRLRLKTEKQGIDLEKLVNELKEEAELRKIQKFEITEALEQSKKQKNKKRRVTISVAMILIYAHLFGKPIPDSVKSLYRSTIKIIPKLVNSMVRLAFEFSMKYKVIQWRQRGRFQTKFMGARCINNILQFSQCIVQGIYETDNPINQIEFFANKAKDYIKKGKMPVFQELVQKSVDQRVLPNWVPEEFKDQIMNEINMFPQLDIKHEVTVDDESIVEQCNEDIFSIKITLTRLNTPEGEDIPFAHSNRYTYVKEEGWHILITYQNEVFYYAQLNGSNRVQSTEFKFQPKMYFGDVVEFEFVLFVISDCYRGLDAEIPIKFKAKKATQISRAVEYHKEDQELDKSLPFIQSMLFPMQNKVEDSDSEDEDQSKKEDE